MEQILNKVDEFNIKMESFQNTTTEDMKLLKNRQQEQANNIKAIQQTKEKIDTLKEEYDNAETQSKIKIPSELLKTQKGLEKTKSKIQAKIKEKDSAKLYSKLSEQIDYASKCLSLSEMAFEEAKLAYIEALDIENQIVKNN